eukprot:5127310-Lingulodinium_polyedra.AAC.1
MTNLRPERYCCGKQSLVGQSVETNRSQPSQPKPTETNRNRPRSNGRNRTHCAGRCLPAC